MPLAHGPEQPEDLRLQALRRLGQLLDRYDVRFDRVPGNAPGCGPRVQITIHLRARKDDPSACIALHFEATREAMGFQRAGLDVTTINLALALEQLSGLVP